jgi:two-component system aerobic respiration control sensor histidine kinase ArcB
MSGPIKTGQKDPIPAAADPALDRLVLFSHDIRAAVSDVIGGLRLIDLTRLDVETRTQLDRVRLSGEALAEMLDAALTSIDGSETRSKDDGVLDLNDYLSGIKSRWLGQAAERHLEFHVTLDAGLPARVALPRIALDRILGNLIGNALKFTRSGVVRLSVDLTSERVLRFLVTDTGPGFADAAMAQLFRKHGRPVENELPGTGLGLHISKGLADEIGAELTVRSRRSQGAEVMLAIPFARWAPEGEFDTPVPPPDLSDLHILVAEDNATSQLLVGQMLEKMGASFAMASDGKQALDLLAGDRFDIALIDIEMPILSGMGMIRRVRSQIDGPFAMPMVAPTASVQRDNREAIYAAGADGIIAKPIRSISAFGAAVRRHIDYRVPQSDAPLRMPDAKAPLEMDCARFDALMLAAGPSAQVELLDRLHEDLSRVHKALSAGISQHSVRDIRAQTHILISLAGAVGADRLQDIAEALNAAAHRHRLGDVPGLSKACDQDLTALIAFVAGERAERRC